MRKRKKKEKKNQMIVNNNTLVIADFNEIPSHLEGEKKEEII